MIPLLTQLQFEGLLEKTSNKVNLNKAIVVYFTASWCGACTKLDFTAIQASNPNIVWYKCDIDVNKYTLGYCGLSKIPSFVFIKDGKFLGKFTSSDTGMVIDMITETFN